MSPCLRPRLATDSSFVGSNRRSSVPFGFRASLNVSVILQRVVTISKSSTTGWAASTFTRVCPEGVRIRRVIDIWLQSVQSTRPLIPLGLSLPHHSLSLSTTLTHSPTHPLTHSLTHSWRGMKEPVLRLTTATVRFTYTHSLNGSARTY
eukprot:m.203335 g.203335  ORF g.203335 m.203335 type:complete len:149 (-) comp25271_c0_seq3:58-504(-)